MMSTSQGVVTACSTCRNRTHRRPRRRPPRRWRCGCARGRWTRSSGRRTCSRPARRCAASSREARRRRCCCTGRRARARPRWRATGRPCYAEWEPALRRAVGAVVRGQRARAVIDDARLPARPRAADRAVRRRDDRFSKTQQDALLGAVEDRLVLLVAATTENPSFSVVAPLLSRSLVLALQPLPTTTCAPCCAGPSPSRGGWAGRSRSVPRRRTRSSGWRAATRAAP